MLITLLELTSEDWAETIRLANNPDDVVHLEKTYHASRFRIEFPKTLSEAQFVARWAPGSVLAKIAKKSRVKGICIKAGLALVHSNLLDQEEVRFSAEIPAVYIGPETAWMFISESLERAL